MVRGSSRYMYTCTAESVPWLRQAAKVKRVSSETRHGTGLRVAKGARDLLYTQLGSSRRVPLSLRLITSKATSCPVVVRQEFPIKLEMKKEPRNEFRFHFICFYFSSLTSCAELTTRATPIHRNILRLVSRLFPFPFPDPVLTYSQSHSSPSHFAESFFAFSFSFSLSRRPVFFFSCLFLCLFHKKENILTFLFNCQL